MPPVPTAKHRQNPQPRSHRQHSQEDFSAPRDHSPSPDRKSTRLNSSHLQISYAVFCLKKKNEWNPMTTSILLILSRKTLFSPQTPVPRYFAPSPWKAHSTGDRFFHWITNLDNPLMTFA